jgi:hypothetical protein
VTSVQADQPLEQEACVERCDEGDECVMGERRSFEVELVPRSRERIAEDLAPLNMDVCDPLLEMGAVPGDGV